MSSLFDFTPENNEELKQPKDIVKEQCDELAKLTHDYVIGKIEPYDGPIRNHPSHLSVSLAASLTQSFNVQNELGDISENRFTYEFFISSKYTPNFKYRVFFLDYGIPCYPLEMVLDETIAKQINMDYNVICNNEEELSALLKRVLNSDKMKDVINSLFTICIQEVKNGF